MGTQNLEAHRLIDASSSSMYLFTRSRLFFFTFENPFCRRFFSTLTAHKSYYPKHFLGHIKSHYSPA